MSESGADAEAIPRRKALDWRRVRAGWYVAPMPGATDSGKKLFIHIARTSESHPRWGWDVLVGDDEYETPPRNRIKFTGLADLGWAKLEAEGKYGQYRPVGPEVRRVRQLWISQPDESETRGLRALRESVRAALDPDDSQQYLDSRAAVAWIDRVLNPPTLPSESSTQGSANG
jgi:hypothetical protein